MYLQQLFLEFGRFCDGATEVHCVRKQHGMGLVNLTCTKMMTASNSPHAWLGHAYSVPAHTVKIFHSIANGIECTSIPQSGSAVNSNQPVTIIMTKESMRKLPQSSHKNLVAEVVSVKWCVLSFLRQNMCAVLVTGARVPLDSRGSTDVCQLRRLLG